MALERNPNFVDVPAIAGGAEGLAWFRNPTKWYEEHGEPLVRRESLPVIRGRVDEYSEGGEFDSGGHEYEEEFDEEYDDEFEEEDEE